MLLWPRILLIQQKGAVEDQHQRQCDQKEKEELYALLVKSNAIEAEQNRLLKERSELLKLNADLLKSEINLQEEIATRMLGEIKNEEDRNALAQTLISLEEKRDKLREERNVTETNFNFKNRQKRLKDFEEENKALFEMLDINIKMGDQQKKLGDILRDTTLGEEEKRDALEKSKAINSDFLKLQTKVQGVTTKVAGKFGLTAKFSDSTLGNLVDMGKRFSQMKAALGDRGGAVNVLKKMGGQSFNLNNIFAAALQKAFEFALSIDNLSKSLGAATGFGDKFNDEIRVGLRYISGVGLKICRCQNL